MRLFLDSSVLLAACGSPTGASREIFQRAGRNKWSLICTHYGCQEVAENLAATGSEGVTAWPTLLPQLIVKDDILTLDLPVVFEPAKDRPILLSAYAWADVLLTLDKADFGVLMGAPFYGLIVSTPGRFLKKERLEGRLV